jgi:segregation and condensation protein B
VDKEQIRAIIESLLFAAGEALPLPRLYELVDADKKAVRAALAELQEQMNLPGRGVRLVEAAGGWQFQTSPENAAWVGRLLQSKPVRLSRPSLETLSIIAYRQPVTRPEIEEIRGVDTGGVIKTLLDHDFVQIQGRKDVPGKPLIYGTAKRFLEFFRLKSLADLPTLKEMEELQEEALAGQEVLTVGDEAGTPPPSEAVEPIESEEEWDEEDEKENEESKGEEEEENDEEDED